MTLFGITFAAPLILGALITLPLIWYLLRLTPPRPQREVFPPTRILQELDPREETPAQSPWWLTLLRLLMAALVIFALSEPVWNAPDKKLTGEGTVAIVLDDGWTSAPGWNARIAATEALIEEAAATDRPVSLLLASEDGKSPPTGPASDVLDRLRGAEPQPVNFTYANLADRIARDAPGSVIWLTPDVEPADMDVMNAALENVGSTLILQDDATPSTVTRVINEPDTMVVDLQRVGLNGASAGTVSLYDTQGRSLASEPFAFLDDDLNTNVAFALPVELRNDVARAEIDNAGHAAAVQLLDERFRRRLVGLIAGGNADRAQPLLSPLYYIDRALAPFAQVREASSTNIIEAVNELVEQNTSTMVLADIGTLPGEAETAVSEWIDRGGMLVRFAGPRLAGAEDLDTTGGSLVPVMLRSGGRSLGGTLTWGTPQALARFEDGSPFAGLPVPEDVTVTRQVLAEPDAELPGKTWASLEDGTPLVTASRMGAGWIVLFHVTADASWSNLPLSGAFVDMLRRVVAVSNGSMASERASEGGAVTDAATVLPPLRTLDGEGRLTGPPANVRPASFPPNRILPATLDNPPGLYGTSDAFVALNLIQNTETDLRPFDASGLSGTVSVSSLTTGDPLPFKPWLLGLALFLLALDCLAVLWMAGALRFRRRAASAAAVVLAIFAMPVADARAQADTDLDYTLRTRLAYVETGVDRLDTLSRKGLEGLTRFIGSRTSLEPGPPVGVDIATDELAFFPILYWPLDDESPVPNEASMARVDAFMKGGGTVLFDTRDQLTGGFGGVTVSGATQKLREILSNLDIPPLEPVPDNHVLTRAFYLLDVFPGRYLNGNLWVEASPEEDETDRPARTGDGVSAIMITSNDFAGAWAVESDGSFSLPVVPNEPTQRIYAYRAGVNIVMYMLTGNYKSDQVHVPALLERLGQ